MSLPRDDGAQNVAEHFAIFSDYTLVKLRFYGY